jgi:hypothetical protein
MVHCYLVARTINNYLDTISPQTLESKLNGDKYRMAFGKIYKAISTARSRKAAEIIAREVEGDGLERVTIEKVENARLWEVWAFVVKGYKYIRR